MSEQEHHDVDRTLAPALAAHAVAFRERFGPGGRPRLYFSPGRVNLMGAHLDYNGGPVMPTAIDRGTFLALRARADGRVRLASTLSATELEVELAALPERRTGGWMDYPLGVIRELAVRSSLRQGFELLFGGNLPVGAGLSSSASICVGTAFALDELAGLGLQRMDMVQAALVAEREFVGVQCGIMDPYAVGLARAGSLLWLDCKDKTSEYLPLDTKEFVIAVADTLVRRELAQGAFNQRVVQCRAAFEALRVHQPEATCLRDIEADVLHAARHELEPEVARRAQHVVEEVARTMRARSALLAGEVALFGAEMLRAHESLRTLFEVSVPELDTLVASAMSVPGVLGARLTGAGFGGCVVVLLRRGVEGELARRMESDFESRFGREPVVEVFRGDRGPRRLDPRGA